jgi:hypothetical protein
MYLLVSTLYDLSRPRGMVVSFSGSFVRRIALQIRTFGKLTDSGA